jgi:molecular chaperone GrpE
MSDTQSPEEPITHPAVVEQTQAVEAAHDQASQAEVAAATAGEEHRRLESLRAELEQAQARANEYLDGWQRARAEFANYKKRVEAEREELRRASNIALLLKLLPVVDDFERAFQILPEALVDLPWVDGVRMILRKLETILESENVTPIQAAGQPFDPLWHEAVIQEETAEHPDGYVIEEMQRGYRLGERVLRPAIVKVATNTDKSGNQLAG